MTGPSLSAGRLRASCHRPVLRAVLPSSGSRAAMSLAMSTPVVTPMASNMKTRSSVTTLPLAPGAYGQPPRPPSELSKLRTPTSNAARQLARPRPRVLCRWAAPARARPARRAARVNRRRTCAGLAMPVVSDRPTSSTPACTQATASAITSSSAPRPAACSRTRWTGPPPPARRAPARCAAPPPRAARPPSARASCARWPANALRWPTPAG
jgi:hypothetical protein